MTGKDAAATAVKDLLQADATLEAMIAAGPTDYGPGIYWEEVPSGERYLPAVSFQFAYTMHTHPQGDDDFENVPCVITAHTLGRSFPADIMERVVAILSPGGAGATGAGQAVDDRFCRFEYAGDGGDGEGMIGQVRTRQRVARFNIYVSKVES